MRLPWLRVILILFSISGSVYAGEVQLIKLKDGSVMKAEVISMQHGVYTFRSQSLGEFRVKAKKVESISSSDRSASKAGSADLSFSQVRSKLMANPQTMKMIENLKDDPDLQAILSDPKIMNSIRNGNYKALENNPKFRKLMNNPTILQISASIKNSTSATTGAGNQQ